MSEITRAPIVRVGVDIAKQVIQVHAVDAAGLRVVARALKRDQFLAWCAQLPPGCLVAMEACGGAHHWARRLIAMGLDARLIAAGFVTPYRMQGAGGKNDANDAAAICEAASRPTMRFVPVKTPVQQGLMSLHRLREGSNAGQFGARLGLVPRQNSSGGKTVLGRITRRGDDYLRTLFIQGAKSALMSAHKRGDPISRWVLQLKDRVGWQKACVALANKNARILWAVMTREAGFDAAHVSVKPGAKVKPADSPPAGSAPTTLPLAPPAMCT